MGNPAPYNKRDPKTGRLIPNPDKVHKPIPAPSKLKVRIGKLNTLQDVINAVVNQLAPLALRQGKRTLLAGNEKEKNLWGRDILDFMLKLKQIQDTPVPSQIIIMTNKGNKPVPIETINVNELLPSDAQALAPDEDST